MFFSMHCIVCMWFTDLINSLSTHHNNSRRHWMFSSPEPVSQNELLWSLPVFHPHIWATSSEIPGLIFFKLHVEPSIKGGLKIYTNCRGPLSKMAAMPTYGKTLNSLQSQESFEAESWYIASGTQGLPSLFKWWHLIFFTARSNLRPNGFVWGKYWKVKYY